MQSLVMLHTEELDFMPEKQYTSKSYSSEEKKWTNKEKTLKPIDKPGYLRADYN